MPLLAMASRARMATVATPDMTTDDLAKAAPRRDVVNSGTWLLENLFRTQFPTWLTRC